MPTPASPSIGLNVLHLFFAVGPLTDADGVLAAIDEAREGGDQVVTAALLGHKADVAVMVLRTAADVLRPGHELLHPDEEPADAS